MKKLIGILIIMLLIGTVLPISAQFRNIGFKKEYESNELNNSWYKTYGSDGLDLFCGLELTSDGNYILTGQKDINGNVDAWILKIDPNGDIIWETTYGNPDGLDGVWGVTETSDGGFVCSGWYYQTESGLFDALMIKTDENGVIQWTNIYGTVDEWDDTQDIIETDDGYIMLGFFSGNTEVFVLKTDFDGNEVWTKTFSKSEGQEIIEIIKDGDSYIIVGGFWSSSYPIDAWLFKLDSNGNEIWSKEYGKSLTSDVFTGIDKTSDGNYILVGGNRGGPIMGIWGNDIWLMKVDENGNTLWEKTIGMPFFTDYSVSIQETEDHGFIITGHMMGIGNILLFYSSGWPYWSKICLIKTDSEGNVEWQKLMPGDGHGRTVREIDDGYILCGYTGNWDNSEHAVLIKTDENGNIE